MQCSNCERTWPAEFKVCPICAVALSAAIAKEASGAIAQADSVAAGAGGVAVRGDIHGNVYVGPPAKDPAEALRIYRRVLVSTSQHLPLRGVDVGASDPSGSGLRMDLARVYVELDTKVQVLHIKEKIVQQLRLIPVEKQVELDTRPLRVLEAAAENRCLVVLGDPGSGKSTFLNHLALCLAAGWLGRLPDWPEGASDVVPVPVVLRDFARWLSGVENGAEPRHLWEFVVSRLEAQNLAFAQEPLHQAFEDGRAIVLLDGLDEIPSREGRSFVRDAVAAFAGRYDKSRIVVTCRVLSYQDPAWQLEDFPSVELVPFDEEKIVSFIEAWYVELAQLGVVGPEEAEGLARRLREAVHRPDLWRLAPNPLLLTIMALVHTHKGRLPDARALLYEDTVDILLLRWEQIKARGEEVAPRLRQLLLDAGRSDVDLKRVLWRLAFKVHGEGGVWDDEALTDISEWRLSRALAELHPEKSLDWARQVVGAVKLRAGLLLERVPEVYTFPHRTFQEYLAGAYLSTQADFARQAVWLVEEGAFWWDVVLLAVGRLIYLSGDTDKPLALVGEMCPAETIDDDVAWRKAWLASDVLLEAGLNRVQDSALGRDLVERIRERLVALLEWGCLGPAERAAAGDALAKLGDPRLGVGVRPDGLPDILWCGVSAGPFLMGSDEIQDPKTHRDESPQRRVTLQGYRIAKYPVTNAQYEAFVAAGGYQERRYWTEVGWRWRDDRTGPVTFGGVFDLHNHPVVGVTWHEAVAFCRWLTERLREQGEIEQDEEVMLPSEAQWEKAARGMDGRVFPWGNHPDSNRANYGHTGVGATSAVGCFPSGASSYGVLDMSGNVWEWCRTKWPGSREDRRDDTDLEKFAARVLRGGSFDYPERGIRCAYRHGDLPAPGTNYRGFRVVVAKGFPFVASMPVDVPAVDDMEESTPELPYVQRAMIERLKHIDRLRLLADEVLEDLAVVVTSERHPPGTVFCQQGEVEGKFYAVESGQLLVQIMVGKRQFDVAHLSEGDVFGERGLIWERPRSATVAAETTVDLLVLTRQDFQRLVQKHPSLSRILIGLEVMSLLQETPLFSHLSEEELSALSEYVGLLFFAPDRPICEQGDMGVTMYIVSAGELVAYQLDGRGRSRPVKALKPNDVFGETSLLIGELRDATVITKTHTELCYINKALFDEFLEVYPHVQDKLQPRPDVERKWRVARKGYGTAKEGDVYAAEGEWDRAIEMYRRSVGTLERLGDVDGVAEMFNNLGSMYARKGEWEQAIEMYERSLEVFDRVRDFYAKAQTWMNLGLCYESRGDKKKAAKFLGRAYFSFNQVNQLRLRVGLDAQSDAQQVASILLRVLGSVDAVNAYLARLPAEQEEFPS